MLTKTGRRQKNGQSSAKPVIAPGTGERGGGGVCGVLGISFPAADKRLLLLLLLRFVWSKSRRADKEGSKVTLQAPPPSPPTLTFVAVPPPHHRCPGQPSLPSFSAPCSSPTVPYFPEEPPEPPPPLRCNTLPFPPGAAGRPPALVCVPFSAILVLTCRTRTTPG